MNPFFNIVHVRRLLMRIIVVAATSPRIASHIIILLTTAHPLHYHYWLMVIRRATVMALAWTMIMIMMIRIRVWAMISASVFRMAYGLMPRRLARSIWSSIIRVSDSIMDINCTISSHCMNKWILILMIFSLLTW